MDKPIKELRVLFWNSEGILRDLTEFSHYLADESIDIALICESFLKPHLRCSVPNYVLHRTDRPNVDFGGTAIFVRNTISHHLIPTPQALVALEATTIQVNTQKGPLKLSACYISPNAKFNPADLVLMTNNTEAHILAGDFNAKNPCWNSRVMNPRGRKVADFCDNNGFITHGPDRHTYYSHNPDVRPDTLDIAISRNSNHRVELLTQDLFDSDHLPVLMLLDTAPIQSPITIPLHKRKINWNLFRTHLSSTLNGNPSIKSGHDIDSLADSFSRAIISAAEEAVVGPKSVVKSTDTMPPTILAQIKIKNRVRRIWRESRDPYMKRRWNQLKRKVATLIKEHRRNVWRTRLAELNLQDNSLHKMARAFTKSRAGMPPLHGLRGIAYSDEEKATAFADTFENACTPNVEPSNDDFIDEVESLIEDILSSESTLPHEFPFISIAEVIAAIKKLKARKSPGLDNVSASFLKNLPKKALTHLTKIFNSILRLGYFPSCWKEAKVIMLPKPSANLTFPQDYRPISILSIVGKLFETLLHKRLNSIIKERSLINSEQFGFRESHSTTHQLLRLTEAITKTFNHNRYTGVCFLDISRAFDKVWHDGLIVKLDALGFPRYLVKLLAHYLSNRTFKVQVNSALSNSRPIGAGVPQGGVISPTLFNLYMSDMPKQKNVEMYQYADDTALSSDSWKPYRVRNNLQNALTSLEPWFEKWRMKINTKKSNVTLFTKRLSDEPEPLRFFGDDIRWTNDAKYLGVTLDRRLTFAKHIRNITGQAKGRLHKMYPLMVSDNGMSVENRLLLYKTTIRPILEYASPIWGIAAKFHLDKVQSTQSKALRLITGSPFLKPNIDIHLQYGADFLVKRREKVCTKLYSKLNSVPNDLIKGLGQYTTEGLRFRRPLHIFDTFD